MISETISPDSWATKVYAKLKTEWKVTFVFSMIFGIIAHAYMFLNYYPNLDGVGHFVVSLGDGLGTGRWFFSIAKFVTSKYTIPWLICLVSVFYISVANVCLVELLQVKRRISIYILSGIILCFPSIGATFSYSFLADGYMLAFLMSVLAVVLTVKNKYGFWGGIVLLMLSLGIYQIYVQFAIILFLFLFIRSLAESEAGLKQHILMLLKYAGTVLAGLILYYLINKLVLNWRGLTLGNYQGMNMSGFSLSPNNFLRWINQTFVNIFDFVKLLSNATALKWILPFYLVFTVVVTVAYLVKKKIYRNLWRTILAITVAMVIVLALYFYAINPDVVYHMVMQQTWSLLLITAISVTERLLDDWSPKKWLSTGVRWIAIVLGIAMLYQFFIITNIAYVNVELRHQKEFSFTTRVVDRIEQAEGYTAETPVYLINLNQHITYHNYSAQTVGMMTGAKGNGLINNQFRFTSFAENFLSFTFVDATPEQMSELNENPEVLGMPIWPSTDCVQMINGILVVKIGELATP